MRLHCRLGTREFSASPWFALLSAAALVLFIQLGRWQWHRAAEKRALADAFAQGTAQIVALGAQPLAGLPRYTQVRLRGRYDGAHQFLLDNMARDGRAGFEVLTPLRLDDGRLVLVNRGWLPQGVSRAALPDIGITTPASVELTGRIDHLPVAALAMGRAPPAAGAGWPKLTSFPVSGDLADALLAAGASGPLEAGQVLLGADQPQGYRRDWQPASAGFPPERHMAYAIQWWALAALAAVLFVVMNLRKRPR